MKKVSSSQNRVLYVWLAGIYAVISLYLRNIALFNGLEVLGILLVILLVISLLFWALYRLLGNVPQSGLISFLVVVLFFSYGHSFNLITTMVADGPLTQHAICFPAALAFVALLIYGAFKRPQAGAKLTLFLNLTTIISVCFPLVKMLDYFYYEATVDISPPVPVELAYTQSDPQPDVYYIILDGYAREDWLATWFDFDNSEFIQALQSRGFYVADRSCSNYLETGLSVSSALGMEYLNLPHHGWFMKYREWAFLKSYSAKHNRVAMALMDEGYTYIHIVSRFVTTSFDRHANVVIDFKPSGPYITTDPEAQAHFLTALLPTTLVKPFYEYLQDINHRDQPLSLTDPNRVLMTLDTLKTIPSRAEPTFTFAHVLKPHAPYSFDRNGNVVDSSENYDWNNISVEGYTEQVRFINTRILDVIDTLLANSDVPPIIVIQGDHAWHASEDWLTWRAPILNAYYVPADVSSRLYPTITPVNSFRVIFDSYFGSNLGPLDDITYQSDYGSPFDIHPIEGEFSQTWCPH